MKIDLKRFDSADEVRAFEKGRLELVTVAGRTFGRASYEPGWKWSEHVGPTTGTKSCEVEHIVLVLAGRCAVRMDNGSESVLGPGGLAYVPPGHDSWVVGGEPYVSLHFLGAADYAARKQ